MARERMVTRTVLLTSVEVMCVNVETAEVSINNYELSGYSMNADDAMKQLKKLYETDNFKLVAIQGMEEKEILYGMTEADFIKLAEVLPPRKVYTDK